MGYKSETTKKALKEIKEKNKKETNMKTTKVKTVLKYVATVAVTLGVVYAGYSLFQAGYDQGKTDQKAITVEAKEIAVQLKQND